MDDCSNLTAATAENEKKEDLMHVRRLCVLLPLRFPSSNHSQWPPVLYTPEVLHDTVVTGVKLTSMVCDKNSYIFLLPFSMGNISYGIWQIESIAANGDYS